jgi:radical SAM protein with 4Fe4S-binding SPASM domain
MRSFTESSTPSWIVLQLLEKCNLRCKMCYEWGETGAYHNHAKLAELDPALARRTVEECLPAKPFFEFFGGEPLLYSAIWDLIQLIRQAGCDLAFPTNGTLIEEFADRLVATQPNLVWVSVDGPQQINDRQRGKGVFAKAMRGIQRLSQARDAAGSRFPEIGIAYVVTPLSYRHIEEFFLRNVDLSLLSYVSIELQSYATEAQYSAYARILAERFDVASAPCAKAYVRDPRDFSGMDFESIATQMANVKKVCAARGIRFFSQPRTLQAGNITSYLTADWDNMVDKRNRCAVPWKYAEISARGDVTTCHSFYDLPIGNIYEQGLLDIWQGQRLKEVQSYLRDGLFPICTACCRYHSGADPVGKRTTAATMEQQSLATKRFDDAGSRPEGR